MRKPNKHHLVNQTDYLKHRFLSHSEENQVDISISEKSDGSILVEIDGVKGKVLLEVRKELA